LAANHIDLEFAQRPSTEMPHLDDMLGGGVSPEPMTGLGTTKQGRALARQYREQLADEIGKDHAHGRHRVVWKHLKSDGDDALALRLLVAGISVCTAEAPAGLLEASLVSTT
jgi:hypothetical protein